MTSPNPIERFSLEQSEIDADIMESWLEDNIQSVDEKTLFDLQQLISHYSGVIVPNKTVKVSYPTSVDASACADTDNDEVFIPTSSLLKGDIDHTIGLMIHELHHIKLSLKGSEITETCFYLVNEILKHTFVGDDDNGWEDLYEVVQSHERITYHTIRKHYDPKMDSEEPTKYENFYLNAIKGIAMFLNCIEDVRIDSMTKPTLKRYIDKGDAICAPTFIENYAKGEYDEKNLLNVGYRYLFHHKDFVCDDYIEETYPDVNKLLSSTPFEYIKDVFGIYKKELQQFVRECYRDEDGASESGATGNLDSLLGDDDDGDSNMGELQKLSKDIDFDEETLGDTKTTNSKPIKRYLHQTEATYQPIATVLADSIEVMGKVSIHNTVETNVSDGTTFDYSTIVVDES